MHSGEDRDEPLRSPVSGADPSAVLPLIDTIEKLPASATGAYMFGPTGRPTGTILVERGRVCWAGAAQMGHRLTDILRRRIDKGVEPGALEEIVRRCRLESTPLGEALVASGLLSSDGLRDALRQHTSEAILHLGQAAADSPTWLAHRRQRYDARFTFSPAELLASVGAACMPELAEAARREMQATLSHGGGGLAFTWIGASDAPFPIFEMRTSKLTVSDTIRLADWGAHMRETESVIRAVPRVVVTRSAHGDSMITWATGQVIYVVICQSPSSLAHVLGKRVRASPDGRSGS
jgi:hypothetical protein